MVQTSIASLWLCARRSYGLKFTKEELADDLTRRHFCAISDGTVVATVSLRKLDADTLQLRQMAVAEARRRQGIGWRLLPEAEN